MKQPIPAGKLAFLLLLLLAAGLGGSWLGRGQAQVAAGAPAITPTLDPTPALELPLIANSKCNSASFLDDFSDAGSGWPIFDEGTTAGTYLAGEYQVRSDIFDFLLVASPAAAAPKYMVQAAARYAANLGGFYGLLFSGSADLRQYFAFLVRPDTQEYAVVRYDADDPSGNTLFLVVPNAVSGAIVPDAGDNLLRVVQQDGTFSLAVNGLPLGTWGSSKLLAPARSGFIILPDITDPAGTDVRYDDYWMTSCLAEVVVPPERPRQQPLPALPERPINFSALFRP